MYTYFTIENDSNVKQSDMKKITYIDSLYT